MKSATKVPALLGSLLLFSWSIPTSTFARYVVNVDDRLHPFSIPLVKLVIMLLLLSNFCFLGLAVAEKRNCDTLKKKI